MAQKLEILVTTDIMIDKCKFFSANSFFDLISAKLTNNLRLAKDICTVLSQELN